MSLLGPVGAQARMADLMSKIQAYSASPEPAQNADLKSKLDALKGNIQGTLAPFNPNDPTKATLSAARQKEYEAMADAAAKANGVDPKLFRSLIQAESAWDPTVTSPRDAKGLTQLMDGTAKDLGVEDSYNPEENLNGGAKYLRQMLDRYSGDTKMALAAYNAGPARVDRTGTWAPTHETKAYVEKIMRLSSQ